MNEQQLADKGWQHMSAILDKEMPQRRKKRPAVWWFAAALIAGLVFNHYNQTDSTATQPANTSSRLLEANVESITGGLQQSINHAGTTHNNSISNSNSQEITSPLKNSHFTPKSIADFQVIIAPLPFSTTLPDKNIAPATGQVLFTESNLSRLNNSEQSSYASNGSNSVSTLAHRQPGLSCPSSLPFLEKIPNTARKNTVTVKKATKKHQRSKVNFGLMVGAQAFQVKQVPGFIGGLSIDLNTRSRKFGLQSGIIYRYQEFSGESRPVIPVSYDHYIDATGLDIQPENFPNSWLYLNANKSILVPVMKSHQVEVPALLYWQPHHRFRVYGGASVLRHVWVESAEKALFTYDQQVVYTPDNRAAGNLNNVITGQLPAWEKNWQTGFSFKPVKYLEVGLFYRATWKGKPLLSDAAKLFDTCTSCTAEFPAAEQRTTQSIRPQSLQLTATIKF